MREFVSFASIFGVSTPIVIAVAALVVALIIGIVAFFLFRSGGKKKAANTPPATTDWQRQQAAAQNAWGQQQPAQPGWGQQAGQQQNWGDPNAMQQQQAIPGWGQPAAQPPTGQQGGWGASASPQQPAGWGAPSTQQPSWDAQGQPAAQNWGQQPAPQQQAGWDAAQQPAAPAWGQQAAQQQQPNSWGSPSSPQQQNPAWGAPAAQQAAGWGNQGQGGPGSQPSWDQPQQVSTPPAQDPWAQQQQQQQQPVPAWGAPNTQQPAPTAYGGSGSGQAWGQAPAAPGADPWAQQQQQAAWPGNPQQPISPAPVNNQQPAWQQGQQGQPGTGYAPGGFDNQDGDKTVMGQVGARQQAAPGRLGMVRIEEGKEPGRIYEIRKESLSIGRSRESDIFLEDLAVSRLHASIISMGNGNYALRDEGSANGTKVNGQTVNKYQPYPLQEGDKIQLGQTVLVFGRR